MKYKYGIFNLFSFLLIFVHCFLQRFLGNQPNKFNLTGLIVFHFFYFFIMRRWAHENNVGSFNILGYFGLFFRIQFFQIFNFFPFFMYLTIIVYYLHSNRILSSDLNVFSNFISRKKSWLGNYDKMRKKLERLLRNLSKKNLTE